MSILLPASFYPSVAGAWGAEATHEELATGAIKRFDEQHSFSTYLHDQLGLREGMQTSLVIEETFVPAMDLRRLTHSANIDSWKESPEIARIGIGEPAVIDQLIRAGVWAEDNPNPRARHHFHDPTFEHGPPTGNHGLDDRKPAPGLNNLSEILTFLVRGGEFGRFIASFGCPSIGRHRLCDLFANDSPHIGNFEFRGFSALDRALNRELSGTPSSSESPSNFFALPDVERYLYRGLTAPTKEEREHYLALHFVAFGHVLHLLQDQSSPGHVRNDFVVEHFTRLVWSFEHVGDKRDIARNIFGGINPIGDALFTSRPRAFLSSVGIEDPRYLPDLTGLRANEAGLDLPEYWDQGDPNSATGKGLAEVTQRTVFSTGSIGGAPGLPGEYPLPNLPSSCEAGQTAGAFPNDAFIAELPQRSIFDGERLPDADTYVSSRQIPHLGRCRYHAEILGTNSLFAVTLVDESVQRDYLEALWPIAIDHTAQMMKTYFQKRIHAVPLQAGGFELVNPTMIPFTGHEDAVQIAYEGIDGERHVVDVACTATNSGPTFTLAAAASPGALGVGGQLSCTLPASIAVAARNRDDFWIIARGQHGVRGSTSLDDMNANGWKTEDFVVAFEHQQTRLVYSDEELNPSGTPTTVTKLYQVGIDPAVGLGSPEETAAAADTPRRDLYTEIGAGLVASGSILSPQLTALTLVDVRADSTFNRIAFVRAVASRDTETVIVDLDSDLSGATAYQVADVGADRFYPVDGLPGGQRTNISLAWNKDPAADAIHFATRPVADPPPGQAPLFLMHRFSPSTSQHLSFDYSPFSHNPAFYFITSAFADQLAGTEGVDGDIYLLRQSDLNRTHRIVAPTALGAPGFVEACASDVCGVTTDGSVDTEPDWSQDGTRIAFRAIHPADHQLAIADLSTGVVPALRGAAGTLRGASPAFSPDGRYLAYIGIPDEEIYVVEVAAALAGNAAPVRVTKTPPVPAGQTRTRRVLVWPGTALRLPE